jgi:hypothetical protein
MPRHGRSVQGQGRIPPTPRVGSGVEHRGTKPVKAILPAANRGDVNASGLGSLPQGRAIRAGLQGLFQTVINCGHRSSRFWKYGQWLEVLTARTPLQSVLEGKDEARWIPRA